MYCVVSSTDASAEMKLHRPRAQWRNGRCGIGLGSYKGTETCDGSVFLSSANYVVVVQDGIVAAVIVSRLLFRLRYTTTYNKCQKYLTFA